jgi:hypothetical protein
MDNVNAVNGMGGLAPRRKITQTYNFSETPAPADSVELSSDVMRLNGIKGVRLERVMEVQSKMISDPHFFSGKKIDIALDRAIDDVLGRLPTGR